MCVKLPQASTDIDKGDVQSLLPNDNYMQQILSEMEAMRMEQSKMKGDLLRVREDVSRVTNENKELQKQLALLSGSRQDSMASLYIMPHLQAVVHPAMGKNRHKPLIPQVKHKMIALLSHDY